MKLTIILSKVVNNQQHAQEIFDLVKERLLDYSDVKVTGHITESIETTQPLNGGQ